MSCQCLTRQIWNSIFDISYLLGNQIISINYIILIRNIKIEYYWIINDNYLGLFGSSKAGKPSWTRNISPADVYAMRDFGLIPWNTTRLKRPESSWVKKDVNDNFDEDMSSANDGVARIVIEVIKIDKNLLNWLKLLHCIGIRTDW